MKIGIEWHCPNCKVLCTAENPLDKKNEFTVGEEIKDKCWDCGTTFNVKVMRGELRVEAI